MKTKEKIYLIYKELKKYNSNEFNNIEIINATKDLIDYSKNDYVDKNSLSISNSLNVIPLDRFLCDNKALLENRFVISFEEEDILNNSEIRDFKSINEAA